MGTLIKVDFLRILKNKLFKVGIIVAAIIAVITPLFYFAISNRNKMPGVMATYSIFALMPVGFILALFFSIIAGQEYQFGTIRNKIIIGKKRSHIYFSIFFTTTVTYLVMLICTGLLTGIVSLILFKNFFPAGYNIGKFFMNIGFVFAVYLAIASLISLFSIGLNKIALSIIIIAVGGTVLGTILPLVFQMFVIQNDYSKGLMDLFKILLSVDYFYVVGFYPNIMVMSSDDIFFNFLLNYDTLNIIITVISPIAFFALNYFLGLLSFKRRNIK
jgi:hypothetical protein